MYVLYRWFRFVTPRLTLQLRLGSVDVRVSPTSPVAQSDPGQHRPCEMRLPEARRVDSLPEASARPLLVLGRPALSTVAESSVTAAELQVDDGGAQRAGAPALMQSSAAIIPPPQHDARLQAPPVVFASESSLDRRSPTPSSSGPSAVAGMADLDRALHAKAVLSAHASDTAGESVHPHGSVRSIGSEPDGAMRPQRPHGPPAIVQPSARLALFL